MTRWRREVHVSQKGEKEAQVDQFRVSLPPALTLTYTQRKSRDRGTNLLSNFYLRLRCINRNISMLRTLVSYSHLSHNR